MVETGQYTGRSADLIFTVGPEDLAVALGSGDVPVLATPRMIAWLEAATVAAVAGAMPAGATSVGTAVEIDHVAASVVGSVITASATVGHAEGKSLIFECEAVAQSPDGSTSMVGQGSITRVVVDRERFIAKLPR